MAMAPTMLGSRMNIKMNLVTALLVLTVGASTTFSDPSRRLNPTRPKAFDYAADAEQVVGHLNHNFSCDGREYGYYADQGQNCQVFHICMPVKTVTGRILDTFQFSFFCPSHTRFSQDSRTCISEAQAYSCHKAHTLYDLNKAIGQRPKNKRRPVNLKDAAEVSRKSNFSGSRKSSLSGVPDHNESSGAFAVEDGLTPVHTDSALNIGAPAVSILPSAGNSGFTTNFGSHPRTTPSLTVTGPLDQLSENFEVPDSIIPPGSQIFSTVSLQHQNAITHPTQKDTLRKSAGSVANSERSKISTSSPGTFGLSSINPSTRTQSFTTSTPPTTLSNVNSTPSPFTRIITTTPQSRFTSNSVSQSPRIDVKQGSSALNSVQVNNRGSNAFSPESLQNNQDSSVSFRPLPQRNVQQPNIVINNKELSSSHVLETTTASDTKTFSSTGSRSPISTFASRARAQTTLNTLALSNKHTSQPPSRQGTQTFTSSQRFGNSGTTTHIPTSITESPITSTHQPFTVTRHPTPTLSQQFTPPPPISPPINSGSSTPLRIPGFSAGVIRTGGNIQGRPIGSNNQKQSTLASIPTTTEYYLDDEEYQTIITTQIPFESTKSVTQNTNVASSVLQNNRGSFTTQRTPAQGISNSQRSRTQSVTQSFNNQNSRTQSVTQSFNNQNSRTHSDSQSFNSQNSRTQSGSQTSNSQNSRTQSGSQSFNNQNSRTQSGSQSFNNQNSRTQSGSQSFNNQNSRTQSGSQSLNNQNSRTQSGSQSFNSQNSRTSGFSNSVNKQNTDLELNVDRVSHQPGSNRVGSTNNQRLRTQSSSSGSSNLNQNSDVNNGRVTPVSTGRVNNHVSSTPSSISHSSAHQRGPASGSADSAVRQDAFGRVESVTQRTSNSQGSNKEVLVTSHGAVSQNLQRETSDLRGPASPSGIRQSSTPSQSRDSAALAGQRGSSVSAGNTRSSTARGLRGQLYSGVGDTSNNGLDLTTGKREPSSTPSQSRDSAALAGQRSSSVSAGNTRSSTSRGLRGQLYSEVGDTSNNGLDLTSGKREPQINPTSSTVSRGSANRGSSPTSLTTVERVPTRTVTRNRGSKRFQPSAYLLQSTSLFNAQFSQNQKQNTGLGNNHFRSGSRTQASSSRTNSQSSGLYTSQRTQQQTSQSSPNIQIPDNVVDSQRSSSIINTQSNNGAGRSNTQNSNQISTGSQTLTGRRINSQITTDEYTEIAKDSFVVTTSERPLIQANTPVSSRGRTVASRGTTNFISANSLSSSNTESSRTRNRGTTLPTITTVAPATAQRGFSRASLYSNSQTSSLTTQINKQPTTPATITAKVSLQTQPFTRIQNRHRGTSRTVTGNVETTTVQIDDNIQNTGARTVIKKKIIINGRPGSRRNTKANTPSRVTESQAGGQSDATKSQQQRGLDALARFSPGLANANLLAFRIVPNKPKKNEKDDNIPIVSTTEATNNQGSRVDNSAESFGNRRRGNTRRTNSAVTVTPATTRTTESQQGVQSDNDKNKQQRALDALARFNPAFANANLLSFRIVPNKPKINEKKDNVPVVTTTEATNNQASQVENSVASFSNRRRGNSQRTNSFATPRPATTRPPRIRSRGGTQRLSRPVTQKPAQISSPQPIITTISPFQRLRGRGQGSVSIQRKDESEENRALSSSDNASSSPDASNRQGGNVNFRNSLNNRRRVLKKVTPLANNTSSTSSSPNSSSDFSTRSSSFASRSSRRKTTNSQSLSSTQSSGKPAGQLRVVSTSIESSVSTKLTNQNNARQSFPSSSSSFSSSSPSASSFNSRGRKTSSGSSKLETIHEPLTDLELEALIALAQVNSPLGSARFQSQSVTASKNSVSNNEKGTTSSTRRNSSTSRSRSRSL